MTIFFASPVAMRQRPRACIAASARGVGRELREHLRRADDGPGDEVREEADEEQVVEVAPRRLELAAPDVDRVAHRLEREERDAERQDEPQVRHAARARPAPRASDANESAAKFQYLKTARTPR